MRGMSFFLTVVFVSASVLISRSPAVGDEGPVDEFSNASKEQKSHPHGIPLSNVWAWKMPGTKPLHPTEDKPENDSRSRARRLHERLIAISGDGTMPSAFAVRGSGMVAVEDALDILSDRRMPRGYFKTEDEVSIIFYAEGRSHHVHLEGIERKGLKVLVQYKLVRHLDDSQTSFNYAVIPLGKLPEGSVEVEILEMPSEEAEGGSNRHPPASKEETARVRPSCRFTVFRPDDRFLAHRREIDKQKETEIPLNKIWALNMPGAKDITELDPRTRAKNSKYISNIGRVLTIRSTEPEKAGPCFLVRGEGKVALENAAKILTGEEVPKQTFPTDEELSLVFYSLAAPGYVHLKSVWQSDRHVEVRYQVVIHQSAEMTVHFALIPLGKPPAGQLSVKTFEESPDIPYRDYSRTDFAACDCCTYLIREGGE